VQFIWQLHKLHDYYQLLRTTSLAEYARALPVDDDSAIETSAFTTYEECVLIKLYGRKTRQEPTGFFGLRYPFWCSTNSVLQR
jgi:hypothetical protein